MRRTATPAITSQMYRHFATATVAITALLALFANGENQKAAASPAVGQQYAAKIVVKPRKPHPAARFDSGGIWGSDTNDGFGQPTLPAPVSGGFQMPNPLGPGHERGTVSRVALGNPDEQAAEQTAGPNSSQIAAATAASRLRSGSNGRN